LQWHLQASHDAQPQLPPLGQFNYAARAYGGKPFAHACRLGSGPFYVFKIQDSHMFAPKVDRIPASREPVRKPASLSSYRPLLSSFLPGWFFFFQSRQSITPDLS
jgi:hypothetical protein